MTGPVRSPISDARWFSAGPRPADQAPPEGLPEPDIGPGWAERPVLGHLAALAAAAPQALALTDGTRGYTRAALYGAACRVGAVLRAQPWQAGAVGVLLPNDARYMVAKLGVLAAGRPCLLLGPHLPAPLLARIAADAALAGVLASAELAPRLGGVLPVLDADAALAGTDAPAPARLAPDAPAFIVSTSGTTGVPKAVVRTQRALLANHARRIAEVRLGAHDRVAVVGPPATAGALSQRLYGLFSGAGVAVLDPGALGLSGVLAQIRAFHATVLHVTPLLGRALAALPGAPEAFAGLRVVMVGGDTLLHADLALLRHALPPGARVHFGFGLSEAARVASWFVPAEDRRDPVRVASGYLRAGVQVRVVDEAGRDVPVGEEGELVVSTPFAAIGDWSGGRLVPARFADDPQHPGRRVVHTGDLVRIGADGVMVVLGRRDRMVKIAGYRVEPAAVELAMRALPGVADAAVLARGAPGSIRLFGFVVPATPGAATEDAEALVQRVRAALRAALPADMMPSGLRPVAALPLNASGKRDDAALAALLEG